VGKYIGKHTGGTPKKINRETDVAQIAGEHILWKEMVKGIVK
jgi:hypothetical protein